MIRSPVLLGPLLALACRPAPGDGRGGVDFGTITLPGPEVPVADVSGTSVGTGADEVQLCSSSERVAVAWTDDRRDPGGALDLWVAVDAGDGFAEPMRATEADSVASFALACTEAVVAAAWVAGGPVTARTSSDGVTWAGEPVPVDEVSRTRTATDLRLGGADDALVLVWADDRNGAYDVLAAESDGGDWRDPVRLDDDLAGSAYSGRPSLGVADGDVRLVVWEDAADGHRDVRLARTDNGGVTYGATQRLDELEPGVSPSAAPVLCGAGAEWTALWREEGAFLLATSTADAGGQWSASDAVGEGDGPLVCAADGGAVHAVWADGPQIWAASSADGWWSAPLELAFGADPAVAAGGGAVAVGWRDEGWGFVAVGDAPSVQLPGTVRDLALTVRDGEPYAAWSDGGGRVWAGPVSP